MTSRLDEILVVGVARGAAPGVVAVVVDRDSVRYEGAFGERSLAVDMRWPPTPLARSSR